MSKVVQLGKDTPKVHKAKRGVVKLIDHMIQFRKLDLIPASELLSIEVDELESILSGEVAGYSADDLMRLYITLVK